MEICLEQTLVISSHHAVRSGTFIHFATPDHGRISAMARGIKSPASKLAGCDELFSLQRIKVRQRGEHYSLTSSVKLASPVFSGDLRKFYLASLVAESLDYDLTEIEPELFSLLCSYISGPAEPPLAVDLFLICRLLINAGWFPLTDKCPSCSCSLGKGNIQPYYSGGGFLCESCIREKEPLPFSAGFLSPLIQLARTGGMEKAGRIGIAGDCHSLLITTLVDFYNWHRGKPLRSTGLLKNMLCS